MIITALVAFVAYAAGYFSLKWAAAVFSKTTGQDATGLADAVKKDLKG